MILFSFNGRKSLQVLDGLSFRWYEDVLERRRAARVAVRVDQIAAITTVVATAMGTGLALGTMRSRGRTGGCRVLLLIPLVTPEIVAGVSAFVLFAQLGVAPG